MELHILPKKAFDRIHVSTADYTCGKVKIAIRFHEDIQETGDLLYAFDDGDFHLVPEAEFEVEVPDFKLWAPSAPFLHTITVKIRNGLYYRAVRYSLYSSWRQPDLAEW